MSFTFGNINTSSKKESLTLKRYENNILLDYSNKSSSYNSTPVVLVDEHYSSAKVEAIKQFLVSKGLSKFMIVSAINCDIDEKIMKKEGKIKFYRNHISNFEEVLPKNCPIITSGAAIYSLLREDDIYPSYVQQIIFGKSNFLFSKDLTSENCHRVFPIESFNILFRKDFKDLNKSYKVKLAKLQIETVVKKGDTPTPRYPNLNKIFIHDLKEFNEIFYEPNKDRRDEVLAWDLETSGLNFLKDRIGCITLSFDGITGYYIPWRVIEQENNKQKLNTILSNNRQLGANIKFDVKFLWKNGVPAARIDEDVITLGHTLDETRSNSLKTLAFFYSEFGGYERPLDLIKDKIGKGRDVNYIEDIPETILWDYAVMDAIVTRRVYSNMINHLQDLDRRHPNELYPLNGIEQYYKNRRIPAENMYSRIEYKGVYVDKYRLDALREEMQSHLRDLKNQLSEAFEVSSNFEWGSSKQLGQLLEAKGWEELGRSKDGDFLVGDFQLKRWKKTHKEAKIIAEMKSISTMLNTFVGNETSNSVLADFLGINDEEGEKGWTKCLVYHPEDNSWRMHPNFKPMNTDSGRSKCTAPNMQQVPSHSDWASKIKQCIVTPNDDEYFMVTIDYSSLQMRLACIDSRQEDLLHEVLRRPKADVHSATAWSTLAKGNKYDISTISVIFNDGSQKVYLGGEELLTDNKGTLIASDLQKSDIVKGLTISEIETTTEHREITEEEFRRQKGVEPYATMRQAAKGENFLLIFGGSAKVLSDQALETAWSEEQCDEYIFNNHCESELERARLMYKGEPEEKLKNIAVCMRLRENFFKGYPGLWNRIGREKEYAAKHGFCRTSFGKIRNMIELNLRDEDDEKTMSGILRSLENISSNHPAQNSEACIRGRSQFETQEWFIRNNMKSATWNEIHDSADFWIHKTELHDALSHIKHIFERRIPEFGDDWVPLVADCEVSDLKKGDYFKGGRDPINWGVDWKTCKYEDPDPFGVELSSEYEVEYFKARQDYWINKGEKDPLEERIQEYLHSENRLNGLREM